MVEKEKKVNSRYSERVLEKHWKKILPFVVKNRCIKDKDAYKILRLKDGPYANGILREFVKNGSLVEVEDFKNGCVLFFANIQDFYSPDELHSLLPNKEIRRLCSPLELGVVLKHENEKLNPFTIFELALTLYGDKYRGNQFLIQFYGYYVEKNLMRLQIKKKTVGLTPLGLEYGIDEQSIKTLEAREIEGGLALTRKNTLLKNIKSLRDVGKALKRDLESKIIQPIDIRTASDDKFSMTFWLELLFGNQFSDVDFFEWALESLPREDIAIVSGLVQGNFLGVQADKARVLSFNSGMNEVDVQFCAAELALKRIEKRVFGQAIYVHGEDDEMLALSYARMAHVAEGGAISYGFNTKTLSAEKKRRLDLLAFYRKQQIQREIIIPYQYRVGRALLNAKEVSDRINIYKSEYRIIIEILIAKKNNFSYPDEYKDVVNVDALFGNISKKRLVTPDTLILNIHGRIVQFVHSIHFSDITQYVDSIRTPATLMRHFSAKGKDCPWMLLTGNDERLFITHIPGNNERIDGTWVANLPGLQDTELVAQNRIKNFHARISSSKHHRQNTVRKEPVSPGVVQLEACDDGRLRWRILNHRIRNLIEQSKDEPERVERLALLQDTQFGSITMCPELVLLYLDYALFYNKAEHFWYNGDVIHGVNYPQFFAENRFVRLTSIDSQQRFANSLVTPFIVSAPALKDFTGVIGNHEWNTFCTGLVGSNHLNFMEFYLNGVLDALHNVGRETSLKRANTVGRIEMASIRNVSGGKSWINWPYFSDTFAGIYRVAMSHMFRTGGKNPVDSQIKWTQRMANAVSDLSMLLGGHFHSFWLAGVYDKILFQAPGAASISGYEAHRGYTSEPMFQLFTFSNRAGIEIECIPARFLTDYYIPMSPTLKGKKDELAFPNYDSLEYKHGKYSPFVERMIDEITFHLSV